MAYKKSIEVKSVLIVQLLLFLSILFFCHSLYSKNKKASLIIDYATQKTIHQYKADALRHPASLTKIMTLYLVFKALDTGRLSMEQALRVSKTATHRQPTKIGLKQNDTITVKHAISALVVKSANDIATVVAEAIGGTEEMFSRMMTREARQLGMKNTTFKNASGLPHPAQKTTARDMAVLATALIRDFPHYYYFFNQKFFYFRGKKYRSHNKLLKRYKGSDGLKTGYIRASGFNIVVSCVRHGHRLIAIIMGGRTGRARDNRAIRLLNQAYKKFQ